MNRLHILIGLIFFLVTGCSQDEIKNQSSQKQASPNELTLETGFFNDIEEVAGKNVIQNPTNVLALVNKQYSLPEGYTPKDLRRPNIPFSFGNQSVDKSFLRKDAAHYLEKMFAEASNRGIELLGVSGFRSYQRQIELYDAEVERVGEEQAVQVVATPGSSEHQTGLAMDISSHSANLSLSETFGETKEGKWLANNAYRFGFILRYPKGKETLTGYQYEPWHFRFVGEKAAAIIYEKKLTLEEYFNIVEKI